MSNKTQLHGKQKRFCEEYMIDLNATQAAIRAGYSKKTAYSIGHENLKKNHIKTHISNSMKARSLRTEVTADRVLQELAKIAFAEGEKSENKLKALEMLARYLSSCDDLRNMFVFERLRGIEEDAMDKKERDRITKELEQFVAREIARKDIEAGENGEDLVNENMI